MRAIAASQPGRVRLILFIGLATLAALAVLVAAVLLEFRKYLRDEPAPPDDADLRATLEAIPAGQNGLEQLRQLDGETLNFSRFAQARGLDDDEALDLLSGRADNPAVVDAFLAQATPALAQVEALLTLPHFEAEGELANHRDFPQWDVLSCWRSTVNLAATRRWRAGDYAGAAGELKRLQRLVRRLTEGRQWMAALLFAESTHTEALEFLSRMMNDPALPPAVRDELAAMLAPAPDWFPAGARSLRLDYTALAWEVDHFPEKIAAQTRQEDATPTEREINQRAIKFFLPLLFKRNATLRLLGGQFRLLIASLDRPYADLAKEMRAGLDHLARPPAGAEIANVAGRIFAQLEVRAAHYSVEQIFRVAACDRLLQAGFAARAYYDDHGKLPADLAALVPKYLPAVPADPFDGRPLRYDPGKGLLYSVGTSLADNGGSDLAAAPPAAGDERDPFSDPAQPTLVLTFQDRTAPGGEAPGPAAP